MGPILIVDDEFGILAAVRDLLADEGYPTDIALNGLLALEQMMRERPSLVLVDYMMPVLNGPGLMEAMRKDPALRDVPVVLMSASKSDRWKHLACQAFLPKPFNLEQLLEVVQRLVGPPPER
jgi:CheY-like chemotaxis protein